MVPFAGYSMPVQYSAGVMKEHLHTPNALHFEMALAAIKAGNWIFATGDNSEAARANGVPVNRVRIGLFMTTALCAMIFAACQVFDTNTADAAKGNLKELEDIAIAVVGGTLMTGGGSARSSA